MHISNYRKLLLTLFICSFLFIESINAQYSDNNWEAGISAGTTVYQGDLEPGAFGSFKHLKPAIGIYAGKMLGPYFSVRLSYTGGKISAADSDYAAQAWRLQRNLKFSTSINELTARIVFKPYGNGTVTPELRFYPYVFAGAGVAFVHVKRDWSGMSSQMLEQEKSAADLAADTMYHAPAIIPAVPVGAGLGYMLSPAVSLFGELTYHLPVTDYLDGFSRTGNAKKKDNYYILNVGIHINFALKNGYTKCPSVR